MISRQDSRSDDTEHTLDSKVQFNLTFVSDETLQPREAVTRVLAVADVSSAYSQILAAAQGAGAKIVAAALDQSDPSNPSGQLDLIVSRDRADSVEKAIADAKGGTISRSVARSADLNSTTDEKVELRLTISDLSAASAAADDDDERGCFGSGIGAGAICRRRRWRRAGGSLSSIW